MESESLIYEVRDSIGIITINRQHVMNAVYPLADLMPGAMKLAERIASNAPIAIMSAKKIMNESVGIPLSEADQLEREAFGNCFGTWDQREAMMAFVEKRKPKPFLG